MRKQVTTEFFVRSVMSLYEAAKTRVIVDSELSEVFVVKVGMHQRSVLSPFLFALVVDIVREFTRLGALSELLYVDDLVMMSETINGLGSMFLILKEAFESKDLKVKLGNTKIMVSGAITNDDLSNNEVDPCGVCSLRVKATSVCVHSVVGGSMVDVPE